MATLRELKGRIGSVASSEKITGAMKMISSAKMHSAEMALKRLVPYRNQIQTIMGHLLSADGEYSSPLTDVREAKRIAIVVFGSDDGLCGAYNIQVFKFLLTSILDIKAKHGDDVKFEIFPVGKKMVKITKKIADENISIILDNPINTKSTLDEVRNFTDSLKTRFTKREIDKVELVYNHYKSASKQILVCETLMPVSSEAIMGEKASKGTCNNPCIFEPDANKIFNSLLPLYVLSMIQEATSENNASEQAARVMAMQSANDNAKNLLDDLRIVYNKLRQQSITTELLDIIGGQTER